MNAIAPPLFATEAERRAAIRIRNKQADGAFVYSVATTGVYCRPSCAARPARPENIGFHDTPEAAERAGFRPCKRCRPNEAPREAREAAIVAAACRHIEAAEEAPALDALAAEAGLSPHHFHRLFRRIAGVTPRAYCNATRATRLVHNLAEAQSVTAAYYEAGFNSSGRFYEAAPALLGMTPTAFRAGGAGETIAFATAPCRLGHVLAAASAKGICAILLGDSPAPLEADLAARFPRARIEPAPPGFADTLAQVAALIDHPATGLHLPLDIRGTAFQRRVWEALQAIPPGATISYSDLAERVGAPRAVRAVASACAANRLAVAIPCHRALARDGALSGYRWGLERKQALLNAEHTGKPE